MRTSPGSPSHTRAALFLRQVWACRSKQLYERLIWPPTNHLAQGEFHSSTLSHFLNQWSSLATPSQNLSGSSIDSLYMRSYCSTLLTWACARNSFEGSNARSSCSTESMFADGAPVVPCAIVSLCPEGLVI